MRLFVNVYWPTDSNTVYDGRAHADASAAVYRRELVEIEYPGSKEQAANEVQGFTANWLREHFPLPIETPTGRDKGVDDADFLPSAFVGDVVTVGDLNSAARGTGARKSAGKPDWSQLPLWAVNDVLVAWRELSKEDSGAGLWRVIELLAQWQRGEDTLDRATAVLANVIARLLDRKDPPNCGDVLRGFLHTVRVLEFGAKKYAKGNWAKGMGWSTCYTCTLSHLTKYLARDVTDPRAALDEESGVNHLAHAMCNLLFLIGYKTLFPEGDDRVPEFKPGGVK